MKKKILYLILAVFVTVVGMNKVNAASCIDATTGEYSGPIPCATGDILLVGESELDDSGTCQWGGYSGMRNNGRINAVRLTVVDANGNRVSQSADFTNRDANPVLDLTIANLPYADTRYQSSEKKTRNEILTSGTGYTYTSNGPTIYYWGNLPDFESGGGTTLKNYFLTKFATMDTVDLVRIFNILGYDGYKNDLIYEGHYLLVEPLYNFFVSAPYNVTQSSGNGGAMMSEKTKNKISELAEKHSDWVKRYRNATTTEIAAISNEQNKFIEDNYHRMDTQCQAKLKSFSSIWNFGTAKAFYQDCVGDTKPRSKANGANVDSLYICDIKRTYYYGTASEIWYMMKKTNDPLYTYKAGRGGSIETISLNIGGHVHDDDAVAGLMNANPILGESNRYTIMNHVDENYGLGTMHVWMKYIMEGCPNGQCPTTCPDGTIVPEGEDPAVVCPPSYCPDMQTIIPPGKTAAEVCPGYTPTCNYDLKTKITNDCTDGQEGYIRDIGEDENGATNLDEWKCIFDTANAPRNTYEGEFYHPNGSTFFDNNPYCRVACRETVRYKLPSTFEEVAGRRFTIGISNDFTTGLTPNVIEGTTTCSTAYAPGTEVPAINYELFKTHYAAANIAVVNAWNAYQETIAREKAFQAASIASTTSGIHEQCKETKTVRVQTGTVTMSAYGPNPDPDACTVCQKLNGGTPCCWTEATYEERQEYKTWDECFDYGSADFEHGHATYDVYNWRGEYTWYGGKATVEFTTTSDGYHDQTKDARWNEIQHDKQIAEAAYEAAVEQRRILLKVLNMCNNFQRTYSEFEPTLSFAYSETKYKGSHKLAATSQTTAVTNYLVNNQSVGIHEWTTAGYEGSSDTFKVDMLNNYGSIDYIDRTDCNNELQPCVNNIKAQAFPNNISVIQTTRKTYNYEIPNDANRYVAKNGVSYNTAYDAELSDYPYIDTGRSNMPINYTTPGGWYHYYYDYYYANGTANLFGTNQKFLKYNKIEPGGTSSYNGLTLADNLLYHCIYKVDCGLLPCNVSNTCPDGSEMPPDGKCPDYTIEHRICPSGVPMPISGHCPDNKGINIIYRTISLNDPFPGEHGEGRAAGANWNGEATVLGTNMSFIDAYITNNRGVSTEKVYQETPMYQFTLTPANIRAIRKYNRSTGNDYNDYNFECSNGKYCKSEFLEEGIGNGYFGFSSKNPNGGSCFNAYSTDWESCRYSSIGG